MKKKLVSSGLAAMMVMGVSLASQGAASAEPAVAGSSSSVTTKAEKWKGPYSSRTKCIAASGESRGIHAINVKKKCELHTTDNKWWYSTWL